MTHLYSTLEQLTEARIILKQKISKCNDTFFIYGLSKQLEDVDKQIDLLLKYENENSSQSSPAETSNSSNAM